jgi:hypothetical protein
MADEGGNGTRNATGSGRPRRRGKASVSAADFASPAALAGEWVKVPPELPPEPKTPADRTRLALIQNPGKAAPLAKTFTTRAAATQLASTFRRARPERIDPKAKDGTFAAREYQTPTEGKTGRWGVIVWYQPPTTAPALDPPAPQRRLASDRVGGGPGSSRLDDHGTAGQ